MVDITPVSGTSPLSPSEPIRAEKDLRNIAKKLDKSVTDFIQQLREMSSESVKNPAKVQEFAQTIQDLHSNAKLAAGDFCPGCKSSR